MKFKKFILGILAITFLFVCEIELISSSANSISPQEIVVNA